MKIDETKIDFTDAEADLILEELANKIIDESKTSFVDLVNLDGAFKREAYVGDIYAGLGSTIDGYIRYWNAYDEAHNIPVEERKPIKLYIDSNGGYLGDTFTMVDAIKLSKTPVWTICTGAAYSGGFLTFISGHKRIAYPSASFMFHEGSTSSGNVDAGKFRNYADFYDKELKKMEKHIIDVTKITEEEYEKHRKDDWWMCAEEGLEHGFVDEIAKEFI